MQAPKRLCYGGQAGGTFKRGLEIAPIAAAPEENLVPIGPQGNLVKALRRERGRQGN